MRGGILRGMGKAELRERMRGVRDELPAERRAVWSAAIAERVLGLPEVTAAGDSGKVGSGVFAYVSFRSEVETHGLIGLLLGRGAPVAVPRIMERGVMVAHAIESLGELVPGPYGILGPASQSAIRYPPSAITVTLVPGLAFTERGDRLGYGAGHYDRWLAGHDGGLVVGLAFETQVVDAVPTEGHDRRMDAVVTEARVIRCVEQSPGL